MEGCKRSGSPTLPAPCIMSMQTRSTKKAAAARPRPKKAALGAKGAATSATAASTRPKRLLSGSSSQLPQRTKVAATKPKVPRTAKQKRDEQVRKRGGTLNRKGEQLANYADTEVIVAFRDPNLGWDGVVCLKETPSLELGEIIRRLHERGPLERRRGRRKKSHLQDLVGVPCLDDRDDAIEVNDEQEEHNNDDVDGGHADDGEVIDVHTRHDDVNDHENVPHAAENHDVERDPYSFDPQSPLRPAARSQASEPDSDVPALEPTGSSSPRRSKSPEVDGAQGPPTPLAAFEDIDLTTWMPNDDYWMYDPEFDASGNRDLDASLYQQHCQQPNASETGQACSAEPGMGANSPLRPYPTTWPSVGRNGLDPHKAARIAKKVQVMEPQAALLVNLLDQLATSYITVV
ncbi:hypothetical protein PCL_08360 [Purpureocillium lilacinum]|uniref:Uncharacterized protein n=1 Tax=Purpureocillium lilacinum TaxID=33203 RepID=A0A2U3DRW1_PURLI|nr:hypothetical protein PCL_08360 [Purpureocillium lilacinum]